MTQKSLGQKKEDRKTKRGGKEREEGGNDVSHLRQYIRERGEITGQGGGGGKTYYGEGGEKVSLSLRGCDIATDTKEEGGTKASEKKREKVYVLRKNHGGKRLAGQSHRREEGTTKKKKKLCHIGMFSLEEDKKRLCGGEKKRGQ